MQFRHVYMNFRQNFSQKKILSPFQKKTLAETVNCIQRLTQRKPLSWTFCSALMCFPFVVRVFWICVHVWLSFFSAIFRCVFVPMTCALNFGPFSVFSCLLDVFSLCCVCFLDMCARVVVFSAIFRRVFVQMTCALNFAPFGVFSCLLDVFSLCCVCFFGYVCTCGCFFLRFSDVYLGRWHLLTTLCLLVCFHAFWVCFPFVVRVFAICVHVLQ